MNESDIRIAGERPPPSDWFVQAFAHAPIGMALIALRGAAAGRLLAANEALRAILRRGPGELEGLPLAELAPPGEADAGRVLMDRLVTGEITHFHDERRLLRPDGSPVWVLLHASLVTDEDGRPRYAVAQVEDITERRRAEAELRRREAAHRELAEVQGALRRVATAVAAGAAAPEVLAVAAAASAELLGASSAGVFRFEGDEAVQVGAWSEGLAGPAVRMPLGGRTATAEVARTGRPARRDDLRAELDPASARAISGHGAGSSISAPVLIGARTWGCITLSSVEARAFPPGAEGRLAAFAELLALGIASAEHRRQLEQLTLTDPLTGLANRRAFTEHLAADAARARRHGRPLALAMLDIDGFKAINDRLGHAAGDRVLVELATRLGRLSRSFETVARIGGEEFAWVLPDSDLAGARAAAERARGAVAGSPVAGVGRVTISAGVAQLRDGEDLDDLMRRADAALYAAKAAGRDRVSAAPPPVGSIG